MTLSKSPLAGVELGGTKCICILGTGPDDVWARETVPTGEREETLSRIEAILSHWRTQYEPFGALGLASFGPLDLVPGSRAYGRITSTPKPGWQDTDLVARFRARFEVPIGFNTDVNGAALAEGRWGAARGLRDFAYITVGTGVGVGLLVAGQPVVGFTHPELGHIRVARTEGDTWAGSCPFHGDCVEGLVSGPAIAARTGAAPDSLAPDHAVWDLVAFALAQLLHTLVLATAPRRILMGGGVMNAQDHLFTRVRRDLRCSLNGYIQAEEINSALDAYVVPPGLGAMAGPLGALAVAAEALGSG